ncbi:MAG: acyltransferase [Bacteroidales bacterium]|nr:acyltransferase [Bacteroidales bacterium]
MIFSQTIGAIHSEEEFNKLALEAFRYQLQRNRVYAEFTDALGIHASAVTHYSRIPFLPIEFFKTQEVYAAEEEPVITFRSSGTTRMQRSRHAIADLSLYRASLLEGFRILYGEPSRYLICALTPSPEENPDSSLAFMIRTWIEAGAKPGSGFFLKEPERLAELLQSAVLSPQSAMPDYKLPTANCQLPTILLIGLTYALLDFAERYPQPLSGAIIMETGGMKGTRKELVREEVHSILKKAFSVSEIHSEYSMSELLSQAFSTGEGRFHTPPWMKVLIRDPNDPLSWTREGKTGGISIIDLANWYSCPFLATQDLGRLHSDGSFEVLGRFDYSDLRGCNLMVSG